jgi:hypothetical protein
VKGDKMSPAEARKKECPILMHAGMTGAATMVATRIVEPGKIHTETKCVGPECALWRVYSGQEGGECGLIVPWPESNVV